ncbi:uncharacterized protein [Solanum tuberosum]|uniref:uncharacterized protein n=1 Tax=Solanum tuberosum TaxID=4113 RepID=UPI0003D25228|nr:PREDICTED: uncharacterized protein LOC102597431 [Solanum tuberosum]
MAGNLETEPAEDRQTQVITEKINNTHPLFVHPSDTPGSVLIPTKLTGSENYGLWRRSMTIALQAKRKLGFVNGTCRKEQFGTDLHEDWETCNAIVLSWIMNTVSMHLLSGIVYSSNAHLVWEDLKERFDKVNRIRIFQLHREIAMISQGTDSIATYFTRLRELWAEYDDLVPTPRCDCVKSRDYIEHLQGQRLLQFLSGLNDSYEQVRRQLLLKTIEPSLNQAYAMISEDESQRSCPFPAIGGKSEHLAMQINRGQPYRGKKPFVKCDHCGRGGHVKGDCYWLVGRPEEQKGTPDDDSRKRNYAANNNKKPYNSQFQRQKNFNANNVVSDDRRHYATENEGSCSMKNGAGDQVFTDEQYKQLQQLYGRNAPLFSDEQYRQIQEMMNDKKEHTNQHNLAGSLQWQGEGDW